MFQVFRNCSLQYYLQLLGKGILKKDLSSKNTFYKKIRLESIENLAENLGNKFLAKGLF